MECLPMPPTFMIRCARKAGLKVIVERIKIRSNLIHKPSHQRQRESNGRAPLSCWP